MSKEIDAFPAVEFAVKAWKYQRLVIHVPRDLKPLCEDLNAVSHHLSGSQQDICLDLVMFSVFAAIFASPADAPAVVATLAPLELCCEQLYELCRLRKSTRVTLRASFGRFRIAIGHLARHQINNRQPQPAWPHRTYPCYRFHLDSSRLSSYQALGLRVAIRLHRIQLIQDRRYTACLLKGRDIEGLPNACLARYACKARELLRRCQNRLVSTTVHIRLFGHKHFKSKDDYRALYSTLIRPLFLINRSRARGRKGTFSESSPSSQDAPAQSTARKRPTVANTSPYELPDDAKNQHTHVSRRRGNRQDGDRTAIPKGEDEDHTIVVSPPYPNADRDATVRAILTHAYETARAKCALPPLYDIRVMQMSEYIELLKRLPIITPLEKTTTSDLIRATIILTSALLGHDAYSTLKMKVHYSDTTSQLPLTDNENTVDFIYHPSTESLYYLLPREFLGYVGNDEHPFLKSCIPTSRTIQLRLFPPLNSLFLELSHRQYEIVSTTQHDPSVPLFAHPEFPANHKAFVREMDNWLKTLESSCYTNRWSLGRITQSFQVQATRRFGIDPIFAFYISGRRHWSVISPSQYMAFPQAQLSHAIVELHRGWCNSLGEFGPAWFAATHAQLSKFEASPRQTSEIWHGSRCVPQLECLGQYFDVLCTHLSQPWEDKNLKQLIDHHTLFTLLAFHAWEFGTAMRPQRVPRVNPTTVDSTLRWTLLADKDSQYAEERFAMVPKLASELMRIVREQANPALLEGLASLSRFDIKSYQKLQGSLFFFVDPKTKRFLSARPSVLCLIHARFPALAALYPYPPNVHRHFATTMLLNDYHVDFELRNLFLGHKHFGHEPLHCYSATNLSRALRILATLLNLCLKKIRIRAVAWKP